MLSVHDLSRIRSVKANEFYRMNMPFELGLDIGCKFFKEGYYNKKKCLILEKKKYRYQKALSDISGSDIKTTMTILRNWYYKLETGLLRMKFNMQTAVRKSGKHLMNSWLIFVRKDKKKDLEIRIWK